MPQIDFELYVRSPRINATSGVVLTIRMLGAAPDDPTPEELEALEELRDAAVGVQGAVSERHRVGGTNLRPIDRRFDGSWAAFHARIAAWTRLFSEPEARRATDLLTSLFPTGLQFLTSSYEVEWFHSRMLLERIEQEKLEQELVELAGERFVIAVKEAHAVLGEALGLDEDADAKDNAPAVGEQVAALAEAIADYCRVLAGGVKRKDPSSCARFSTAMAPIDTHRAQLRRSSPTSTELGDDELEDDELDIHSPLPPLPPLLDDEEG